MVQTHSVSAKREIAGLLALAGFDGRPRCVLVLSDDLPDLRDSVAAALGVPVESMVDRSEQALLALRDTMLRPETGTRPAPPGYRPVSKWVSSADARTKRPSWRRARRT